MTVISTDPFKSAGKNTVNPNITRIYSDVS